MSSTIENYVSIQNLVSLNIQAQKGVQNRSKMVSKVALGDYAVFKTLQEAPNVLLRWPKDGLQETTKRFHGLASYPKASRQFKVIPKLFQMLHVSVQSRPRHFWSRHSPPMCCFYAGFRTCANRMIEFLQLTCNYSVTLLPPASWMPITLECHLTLHK